MSKDNNKKVRSKGIYNIYKGTQVGVLSRRKEHIPGQLALTDFKVISKETGIKNAGVKEYPIRVFVLEKRNSKCKKQNINYKLLYDRKEVVFLDRLELFKNEKDGDYRILDKVDYLVVLLTEEFFYDFNMIKILLANCDLSPNSKLKLVIDDPNLRKLRKRIELYQYFKQYRKDLEDSGIINCDMQQSYELIQNICSKIGEIFSFALENDMWEDMEFKEKLTYFFQKDGRKISCKYKKEEEGIKNRESMRNEKSEENIPLEKNCHKTVFNEINYFGNVEKTLFNNARDNGTINSVQNNQ